MMVRKMNILKGLLVLTLMVLVFSFLWQENAELANSHVTGMRFAFYRMMLWAAVGALVVGWLVRKRFAASPLDIAVVIYTIYVWSRYVAGDGVEYQVKLTVLMLMLYFVFRLLAELFQRAQQVMLSVFMLVVTIESVYGFLQLYGCLSSNHSLYSFTGSFFNPGPYSGFLAVGACVAFNRVLDLRGGKLLNHWPRHWRVALLQGEYLLSLCCLGLTAILLPAGMSRGAWLAAIVGCGVVAWMRGMGERVKQWVAAHRKKAILWSVAGVVFLLSVGVGAYVIKKDSADGRLLIWKVSLLAMREHPWLGVGVGHFSGAYGDAQAAWFASGKATTQEVNVAGAPEYGFNEYLQKGVELGGIGLLLFLVMIVVGGLGLLGNKKKAGVAGGLACLLVFACFSYPLSVLPLTVTFILLLALSSAYVVVHPEGRWAGVVISIGCLLLTLLNVRKTDEQQKAYASWRNEQVYFDMKIYEGTADNYAGLYPLLREEPRFLFEYGQCLSQIGRYDKSSQILEEAIRMSGDPMFYNILGKNAQAIRCYGLAEKYFKKAADMIPNRLYPLYLLTCFYFDTGQTEKAQQSASLFLQKEPKVMSDAVREMRAEVKRKMTEIGDQRD